MNRDRRAMALWALAAVVGLGIVLRYHDAAFPSVSIDFRVTRTEAEQQAGAFLSRQGYDPSRYRAVTTFGYDDAAKVYLERELGLERADTLMASAVSVWRWDTRFFRPEEQEEFTVSLSPAGRLVGFAHEIEERRAGARLPLEEARGIAERFLAASQALNPDGYRLIEGHTTALDNRADHAFTWERTGFTAGEATYRVTVTVQGDRIGGYTEYLKIPEAWQRDYAHLRSRNELAQYVANVGLIGFVIALLVVFLREMSRKQLLWRFGVRCGGLLAVAFLALTFNLLSLALAEYQTTQSLEGFYGLILVSSLIAAGAWFLFVTLLGAVGSAVYRAMHPEKLAPEWLFSARALRTGEYVQASMIGYMIPLVMLGYITAFYLIGNRFGVWSPAAVDYTDLASTALPWLYPLTIGLQASIFEEGLFRLFAIPFLQRHLKSTFLAVLIPAVCWGFLHSNYPQQPFFIRGVELTAVGVLLGYAFLRYGILCPLIAHYAFDALLLSLFLFQSSRLYFQVSGVVVVGLMLIPLLPALIAWRRGYLIDDPLLLNRTVSQGLAITAEAAPIPSPGPAEPAAAPEPAPVAAEAAPLSRRTLLAVWGCAAAGALLMAAAPVERFLDFLDVTIDHRQAIRIAETYLQERGIETEAFRRTAGFSIASDAAHHAPGIRYIRQQAGVSALNEAYRDRLRPAGWAVRFFRPLQKEEYRVTVGADGKIIGYDHPVDEAAPGDTLTPDAAHALAHAALRVQGWDPGAYRLAESNQERRAARTDHFFIWEDSLHTIGEGRFRLQATVQGGEVVQTRASFKPPEAWVRKEQERTLKDILLMVLGICAAGGLGVLAVMLFLLRLRQGAVNWRFGLCMAALLTGLSILSRLNGLPFWYAGYDTTESPGNFLAQRILSEFVVGPVVFMFAGVLLFGFIESVYRLVYPDRPGLVAWFRRLMRGDAAFGRTTIRDAAALSYAACLLVPGVRHLLDLGEAWLGVDTGRVQAAVPHLETAWPVVGALLDALSDTLDTGALLLAALLLVRFYVRQWWWTPLLLLALVGVYQADQAKTWTEFGALTVRSLVIIGTGWLCMRYAWRENLLAYGLTLFLVSLTGDARAMLEGSSGAYRMEGLGILLLACLPAIWWGTWGRKTKEKQA
jgi:membrane protease YdiL (CAAX protease family)